MTYDIIASRDEMRPMGRTKKSRKYINSYTVTLTNSFDCDLGTEKFNSIDEVRKYVSDYLSVVANGDKLIFGIERLISGD